jgi:hypothetical protein
MDFTKIVAFFKELNEQQRIDIVKLINRDKTIEKENALILATKLKDFILAKDASLAPQLKADAAASLLDMVGFNRFDDVRAPLELKSEELDALLDSALGYENKHFNQDMAETILGFAVKEVESPLSIETKRAFEAYLTKKLGHVNVVKKVIEEDRGMEFKALGHNPNAPSMERIAKEQESARQRGVEAPVANQADNSKVTLEAVRQAQRNDEQFASNKPVAPSGSESQPSPPNTPQAEPSSAPEIRFVESVDEDVLVDKTLEQSLKENNIDNDDKSLTITPSALDYRDKYAINFEKAAYAREQIQRELDRLAKPDPENNNFGRQFKDMNLWRKVGAGIKLTMKREPGAFNDLKGHNLFNSSLGEYDEDGRLMNVHLHTSSGKVSMPNAHSSPEIYRVAALKVLEKGIDKPYIKANFANPEDGKLYINQMVKNLMDVGYDIDDISVHPRFSKYFAEYKKHILASQNFISEAPDDVVLDDVKEVKPTRESINGMISPITRAMAGGGKYKDASGEMVSNPAKPINQFSAEELVSVLEGNRVMKEFFAKDPNEYFLTTQNKYTVSTTEAYVQKLIEKLGTQSKLKDAVDGLGPKEMQKLKALYANGVTEYLEDSPEHAAQLERYMENPEVKLTPLQKPKPNVAQSQETSVPKKPEKENPSSTPTETPKVETPKVDTPQVSEPAAPVEKAKPAADKAQSKDDLTPEQKKNIASINRIAAAIESGSYKPRSSDLGVLNVVKSIDTAKIGNSKTSASIDRMTAFINDAAQKMVDGTRIDKGMYAMLAKSKPDLLASAIGDKLSSDVKGKLKKSKPEAPKSSSVDLGSKFSTSPVVSDSEKRKSIESDAVDPVLNEFADLNAEPTKDSQNDIKTPPEEAPPQAPSQNDISDFDLAMMQAQESNEMEEDVYIPEDMKQSDEQKITRSRSPGR